MCQYERSSKYAMERRLNCRFAYLRLFILHLDRSTPLACSTEANITRVTMETKQNVHTIVPYLLVANRERERERALITHREGHRDKR